MSEPITGREGNSPVVQLSIDVIDLAAAIDVGRMGKRAGVDWLEFGTPLISWVGINAFAEFLAEFPDEVTFLDAKVMDGSQPYVHFAGELGIEMVSVCGAAADATLSTAVALAKESGVKVIADLCGVRDPVARAEQLLELDVDAIYLHYGWDEFATRPEGDPTLEQLAKLRPLTDLPLGIVTSGTEMAEEAVRAGADVLLVGHPFLLGEEAEAGLTDYCARVRAAAEACGR